MTNGEISRPRFSLFIHHSRANPHWIASCNLFIVKSLLPKVQKQCSEFAHDLHLFPLMTGYLRNKALLLCKSLHTQLSTTSCFHDS
jgi:hypothetical protein